MLKQESFHSLILGIQNPLERGGFVILKKYSTGYPCVKRRLIDISLQPCYDLNMPVGESPVQLRLAKAEGRHNKTPAILAGFLFSVIFDTIGCKFLLAASELHIGHYTPECYVTCSDSSKHNPHFDILLSHNGDKSPVLNFLHRDRAVSC